MAASRTEMLDSGYPCLDPLSRTLLLHDLNAANLVLMIIGLAKGGGISP